MSGGKTGSGSENNSILPGTIPEVPTSSRGGSRSSPYASQDTRKYSRGDEQIQLQQQYQQIPASHIQQQPTKLKLILLCHSSAVETSLEEGGSHASSRDNDDDEENDGDKEIYQDEYGKCSTFSKINISASDRVITLKKLIENRFGIACDDQILVYKDKILNSDLKLLSHYKLRQFARIHIFDERDIKESDGNEDDSMFGVYQTNKFGQVSSYLFDLIFLIDLIAYFWSGLTFRVRFTRFN